MTDYLMRYVETKRLLSSTAAEAAQLFVENIIKHGAPAVIVTDRGTAFTAQLLRTALTLSGTAHRRTAAYQPQRNGLTERLNKTLADKLCIYVDVERKKWDKI